MKYLSFILIIILFTSHFVIGQETAKDTIKKLLNDIEYEFGTTDEGIYYVTLEFEDSRTQLVRIEPFTSNVTNDVQFDVWSPVASYTATIPDSIAHRMFIENGEIDIGRFQSYKSENGYLLIFSAVFYGNFDQNILKKIITDVAAVSDIFEFELTQKDDY